MESDQIEKKFPSFIESELFKIYFSSMADVDRNISNVDIYIPPGDVHKMITSITYTIQFICMNKVVDQVSIITKYSTTGKDVLIKFVKHLSSNIITPEQAREIYDRKRVGFPRKPFLVSNNTRISFSRVEENDFFIKLTDIDTNKTVHAGVLTFNNIGSNDRVDVESVVNCIVKTAKEMSDDDVYKIKFNLISPTFNRGVIVAKLTDQYKVALCSDRKKNVIHFFDVGIVKVLFENRESQLVSHTSHPKTRLNISATNFKNTDILSYIFHSYHPVY